MQTLHTVLLVVQVLVAIGLIGFILIQHGKGADAGAAFGSGASATIFGARGAGNFFSRATAVLAFVFLVNCLVLAYIATERVRGQKSLMEGTEPATTSQTVSIPLANADQPAATDAPAATDTAPGAETAPADTAPADAAAPAPGQSETPAAPQQ